MSQHHLGSGWSDLNKTVLLERNYFIMSTHHMVGGNVFSQRIFDYHDLFKMCRVSHITIYKVIVAYSLAHGITTVTATRRKQ